jgi:flagellar basal-body rod protein FlgB
MTADGNNVDTDTEMADLTQNAVEYETLAAVEQQRFATIKTALGS